MLDEGITRRTLLRTTGAGLISLGGGGALAGCGSRPSRRGASTVGGPRQGGTLTFGAQGGANTDTLDAHNALTNTDFARLSQLYDALVRMDNRGRPRLAMAESITPNRARDRMDDRAQAWAEGPRRVAVRRP